VNCRWRVANGPIRKPSFSDYFARHRRTSHTTPQPSRAVERMLRHNGLRRQVFGHHYRRQCGFALFVQIRNPFPRQTDVDELLNIPKDSLPDREISSLSTLAIWQPSMLLGSSQMRRQLSSDGEIPPPCPYATCTSLSRPSLHRACASLFSRREIALSRCESCVETVNWVDQLSEIISGDSNKFWDRRHSSLDQAW
jgi:hypothetical protein